MRSLQNERGVAMLLAIFAMVISLVIATEVAYETQVDYVSASNAVNRVKAYYAAKAGVELSLFRILLYKKALAQFGDQLKDNKALLDPIWQFPFSWPPIGLEKLNEVDKDQIQSLVKESSLDAQYAVTIDSEGGRIDINDLGSESEPVAKAVRMQLMQIFENELENNKAFNEKYENFKFDELINNIQDWIDEDKAAIGTRGDESAIYKQPEEVRNYTLPPNAPFKSLSELHMVQGMEDEFYDLLKDKITVYGTKGINVNYAPENVLKSLDPQIKDKPLAEILKRRSDPDLGGPFKDEDDFYSFIEGQGVRTENLRKAKIPFLFDAEYNFRIISGGQAGNVRREITVITYDVDNITSRYTEILNKLDDEAAGSGGGGSGTGGGGGGGGGTPDDKTKKDKEKIKTPKGKPTIVFWQES